MESFFSGSGSGSGSISFDDSFTETQAGPVIRPKSPARIAQDQPPIEAAPPRSPTPTRVSFAQPPAGISQAQPPPVLTGLASPIGSFGSVSVDGSISFDDDSSHQIQWGSAARPTSPARTTQVQSRLEVPPSAQPPPMVAPTPAAAQASRLSQKIDAVKSMLAPGVQPEGQDLFYGRDDLIHARHQTLYSIFDEHEEDYNKLMNSESIDELKLYIAENFSKAVWLDFLKNKLMMIIENYITEDQRELLMRDDYNIETMLRIVGANLEEHRRNVALMDISFEIPESAEGIGIAIERCRQRTTEVISELQSTIRNQQDEIVLLKNELLSMKELRAELEAAKNYILILQESRPVFDPSSRQEFTQELQYRLHAHENMNSSLQDELEAERQSKEEILSQYLKSEAKRLNDQNQQLREIAEAVKDLEMQDMFRDAVISKIQTLTSNPSEVNRAVNEWLRTLHAAIQKKGDKVFKMTKELQTLNSRAAHLEVSTENQLQQLKAMEAKTEALLSKRQEEVLKKYEEKEAAEVQLKDATEKAEALFEELKTKDEQMKYLDEEMNAVCEEIRIKSEQLKQLQKQHDEWFKALDTLNQEVTKKKTDHDIMMKYHSDLLAKRDEFRERYPTLLPRFTSDLKGQGSLKTIVETASGGETDESSIKAKRPQGYRERLRAKQDFAKFVEQKHRDRIRSEKLRKMFTPGKMSRALSTGYIDEQTDPMLQAQRIPLVPKTPSGSPFRIPSVQITPPSPTGGTSDTAFSFETKTSPLNRTLTVTSPKTQEPFLVNIGVDPKPLTDTESGEVFTCDISVGIQPGSHDMLPQITSGSTIRSPDTSYHLNVPPEVPSLINRRRARTSARRFSPESSIPYY